MATEKTKNTFTRVVLGGRYESANTTTQDSLIYALANLIPSEVLEPTPSSFTSKLNVHIELIRKLTDQLKNSESKDRKLTAEQLLYYEGLTAERHERHARLAKYLGEVQGNEELKNIKEPPSLIAYNITPSFISVYVVIKVTVEGSCVSKGLCFNFGPSFLTRKLSA